MSSSIEKAMRALRALKREKAEGGAGESASNRPRPQDADREPSFPDTRSADDPETQLDFVDSEWAPTIFGPTVMDDEPAGGGAASDPEPPEAPETPKGSRASSRSWAPERPAGAALEDLDEPPTQRVSAPGGTRGDGPTGRSVSSERIRAARARALREKIDRLEADVDKASADLFPFFGDPPAPDPNLPDVDGFGDAPRAPADPAQRSRRASPPEGVSARGVQAGAATLGAAGAIVAGVAGAAAAAKAAQPSRADAAADRTASPPVPSDLDASPDSTLDSEFDSRFDSEFDSRLDSELDSRLDSELDSEIDSRPPAEVAPPREPRAEQVDTTGDSAVDSTLDSTLDSTADSTIDSTIDSRLDDDSLVADAGAAVGAGAAASAAAGAVAGAVVARARTPRRMVPPLRVTTPVNLELKAIGARSYVDASSAADPMRKAFSGITADIAEDLGPDEAGIDERCIVVTSARVGDGRSTCSLHLAMSLAVDQRQRVIWIDADLHGSSILQRLGVKPGNGLADWFRQKVKAVEEILVPSPVPGMLLIGRGSGVALAENGTKFERGRFDALLRALRDRDPDAFVVIDAPVIGPEVDAPLLASMAGMVIVVVAADDTPRKQVKQALARLEGQRRVVTLLNRAPR